jgi:hypothetical protein
MTRAGTGDLYTPTWKLQEAVKSRETDVLDALSIDWRKGNPHITCPYPTHGGEADWRWDARVAAPAARARRATASSMSL